MISLADFKRKHPPPAHISHYIANKMNLDPATVSARPAFSWVDSDFPFPECREQKPPGETCRLYASVLNSELHMRLFTEQSDFVFAFDDQKALDDFSFYDGAKYVAKMYEGESLQPDLQYVRETLESGNFKIPETKLYHIGTPSANGASVGKKDMGRGQLCELLSLYGPLVMSIAIKDAWRNHHTTTQPEPVPLDEPGSSSTGVGLHAIVVYGWNSSGPGSPFLYRICENRGSGWGANGHALRQAGKRPVGHEVLIFASDVEKKDEGPAGDPTPSQEMKKKSKKKKKCTIS